MAFEDKIFKNPEWWELCYKGSNGQCPSDAYVNITSSFEGPAGYGMGNN